MEAMTIVFGIIGVGVHLFLFTFLAYVLIMEIRPPGRATYIAETISMMKEIEEKYLPSLHLSIPQEFGRSLIVCYVAYGHLCQRFPDSVKTQGEIQQTLGGNRGFRGIPNIIHVHKSGMYKHGVGLRKEIDRLMKREWKPNRKHIKKMTKTVDLSRLDGVFLQIFNFLNEGDQKIKDIKRWRRAERRRMNSEEMKRFGKMLAVAGFVSVVVGVGVGMKAFSLAQGDGE